jgi:hypothetical protein
VDSGESKYPDPFPLASDKSLYYTDESPRCQDVRRGRGFFFEVANLLNITGEFLPTASFLYPRGL